MRTAAQVVANKVFNFAMGIPPSLRRIVGSFGDLGNSVRFARRTLCSPTRSISRLSLWPETRIGIFPGGGGTQRLPRIIGEAKALEFILRGLTVTGQRAYDMGLVHEAVADPLARALEIGIELSGRGAEGLAHAKRLTRAALDRPLFDGLIDERKSFAAVMRTASAREGLRAGREPVEIQKL